MHGAAGVPEIDLLIGELTSANNNDSADAVIPACAGRGHYSRQIGSIV
jgi:hypothetical protein